MISIDNQDLFKKYYQAEYDFNTSSLKEDEVDEIKKLAKEKRVDYALAPIGESIFEWIISQESNIRFEMVDFDSENIDGLLYIPQTGSDKAYIVLNSKKPLINQIFTAAHEYYHYITDYARIKKEPYICDFTELVNVNEMKASRFAAELLLPEEALRNEIKQYKKKFPGFEKQPIAFCFYAAICISLTVRYELPLKAVIYRLYEESYIDSVDEYIKNYDFIKEVLKEIKLFEEPVKRLYSCMNSFIKTNELIYRQMQLVFDAGLVSREEIKNDVEILNLNLQLFAGGEIEPEEDDDDDDEQDLINNIKEIWGNDL